MAFIDVFEKILHRSDRCSDLDINVTIIFCEEIWIVWNNMCVREYMSVFVNGDTIVGSSIDWVSIHLR